MLVLNRRDHESILIGDDIRITVRRTTSGSCKLAIEAPDGVRILREELKPFDEPNDDRRPSDERSYP